MNNDERRTEARIDSELLQLIAVDSINNKCIGSVVNLSKHGLMLLSELDVDPQGVLQIHIQNAKSLDADPILDAAIKVSWRSKANTPDNYWLGVQIIGITDHDQEKLNLLVKQAEKF